MEVAAASANEVDLERTQTASAFPKLIEWPTVPEEEHIPKGVSPGFIRKPTLRLNGDFPAKTPTTLSLEVAMKISPPFSQMTSGERGMRSLPTNSAMAPATLAMGPTLANREALSISFTILGA